MMIMTVLKFYPSVINLYQVREKRAIAFSHHAKQLEMQTVQQMNGFVPPLAMYVRLEVYQEVVKGFVVHKVVPGLVYMKKL